MKQHERITTRTTRIKVVFFVQSVTREVLLLLSRVDLLHQFTCDSLRSSTYMKQSCDCLVTEQEVLMAAGDRTTFII